MAETEPTTADETPEVDPPVDAAVVGTAAAMDPTGTTVIAAFLAGVVGTATGLGRRIVNTFGPGRPRSG